jgi:hypothetical protein
MNIAFEVVLLYKNMRAKINVFEDFLVVAIWVFG